MNDSELTGDALLRRIDELTHASVRDPAGGNGWRQVLFAAGCEIVNISQEAKILEHDVAALHRELREARDD